MTREQALETIRAACIAWKKKYERTDRAIGYDTFDLADVLGAIGKKWPDENPYPKEQYWSVDMWGNFIDKYEMGHDKWNLPKPLEDQETPLLLFIADLLK